MIRPRRAIDAQVVLSVGGLFGLAAVFALFRRFTSELQAVPEALEK